MSDAAPRQAYACSRCAGSGRMSQFSNVIGGKCFRCRGTGKQYTKPTKPSPKWAVFGHNPSVAQLAQAAHPLAHVGPLRGPVGVAQAPKAAGKF